MNKLDFAYRSLGICEEVCREKQAEIDALKAQRDALLAALGWYGEHSRLARLITSEGDAGRNAIASDGGQKAREAIAKARGDL